MLAMGQREVGNTPRGPTGGGGHCMRACDRDRLVPSFDGVRASSMG
jgi:hypothetical protein